MTDLPQEFGVSIVHVDGHSSVRVTGEIDLATATELRQRLNSEIAAGDVDLDLDLSDVTFLDSSGLVVLLAARLSTTARHAPPADGAKPIAAWCCESSS